MKTNVIPFIVSLLVFFFSSHSSLFSQVHQHGGPAEESSHSRSQSDAPDQDTDDEESLIEVEPGKQQLIGVRTVEAAIKPMTRVIRTVGRIEYDERRLATVNTKFEGWIEKLHVDYTGMYVKKGQALAEIYSPELVASQQEFLNVLKWSQSPASAPRSPIELMLSRDAAKIVDASRQRLKLWDITDEQIRVMEETGRPSRTLTVYSPADGYVIQKMALQGMRVMPGEKLFDLADLSTVWVISDIYEYELSLIKTGQPAAISLSYFPGKVFPSVIDYIYPSLSGDTRTAKVRFTINNPAGQLKPQMYTTVEIMIDLGKRLSIPYESVIDTGTRQIIYVDKGDGYFEPREVHLGVRADGMTEVLHGLEAGERVASSGAFLLDSEAQLKGVKPVRLK